MSWYRLAAAEEARKTNSEEANAMRGGRAGRSRVGPIRHERNRHGDAVRCRPGEANHKSHQAVSQDDIVQKEAPDQVGRSIDDRFADTVNLDRSKEQWKSAAYEMGVQLDAYAKLWGVEGANLAMNLRAVTREKQDYREFLRKFARMGEQIRVNDDEFDYVYYCYGLKRYGNLPLIEPLEYVEERRIRDFVIAIDTSASTKDGLVRRFIEKTYAILSQETSFFADMNVLIVQCDAAITDVARISNLRDLDDYLDGLEIKGLGGTDFRPVFATWTTRGARRPREPGRPHLLHRRAGNLSRPQARLRHRVRLRRRRLGRRESERPCVGHESGARRNRRIGRNVLKGACPLLGHQLARRAIMDIRQAKQQIKNAMLAYFSKDEFGNYRLPTERQRPVFLLGAPASGRRPSWSRSPRTSTWGSCRIR